MQLCFPQTLGHTFMKMHLWAFSCQIIIHFLNQNKFKTMRNLYIISLIILAAGSCTFKQDVTFNKDWSGDMSCVMDMSMMAALAGDSVPMPSMLEDSASQIKIKKLEAVPGISKVKVSEDAKGTYTINYHFKDLKALNKSGNALFSDDETHTDFAYFKLQKKNELYFSFPVAPMDKTEQEEGADAMGEGFEYELSLSFSSKIKSIITKNGALISDDKKTVSFKTNITAMTSPGYAPEMLIKLEK